MHCTHQKYHREHTVNGALHETERARIFLFDMLQVKSKGKQPDTDCKSQQIAPAGCHGRSVSARLPQRSGTIACEHADHDRHCKQKVRSLAYTAVMIRVTGSIAIDDAEIELRFVRSAGPGGQNVNKVATAVQLRFDVAHSPSLPGLVRERLARLSGRRMSADGVLIITAQRFRTQARNREDAIERLVSLIRQAAVAPRTRTPTGPSRAERRRRLEEKRRQGEKKRLRSRYDPD